MSVQENKEFIRQYYSWDAAKVLKEAGSKKFELHDPGFMYHAVTGDMNLEQYGQMMQMLSMAFPDWKQTVEDIVAEGTISPSGLFSSALIRGPSWAFLLRARKLP